MMKKLLLLSLCFLFGCDEATQKQIDPITLLPKSQRHYFEVQKHFHELYSQAINDIIKDDIQNKYNQWVTKFLLDTMHRKIDGWHVRVDQVDKGYMRGVFYIYGKFNDDIGIIDGAGNKTVFYQEIDYDNRGELDSSKLYPKLKKLQSFDYGYLYAKIKSFDEYSPADGVNQVRLREITIEVDSIVNVGYAQIPRK